MACQKLVSSCGGLEPNIPVDSSWKDVSAWLFQDADVGIMLPSDWAMKDDRRAPIFHHLSEVMSWKKPAQELVARWCWQMLGFWNKMTSRAELWRRVSRLEACQIASSNLENVVVIPVKAISKDRSIESSSARTAAQQELNSTLLEQLQTAWSDCNSTVSSYCNEADDSNIPAYQYLLDRSVAALICSSTNRSCKVQLKAFSSEHSPLQFWPVKTNLLQFAWNVLNAQTVRIFCVAVDQVTIEAIH